MKTGSDRPHRMDHSGPPPDGASVGNANSVPDEVVCKEFVELITDYFEDTLPPRKLSHVEEHLVLCDWCRTYLDQMQATIGALGGSESGAWLSRLSRFSRHSGAGESPTGDDRL
jgi:hypothetical protein